YLEESDRSRVRARGRRRGDRGCVRETIGKCVGGGHYAGLSHCRHRVRVRAERACCLTRAGPAPLGGGVPYTKGTPKSASWSSRKASSARSSGFRSWATAS